MILRLTACLALLVSAGALSAAEPDGKALYRKHCSSCHGLEGTPAPLFAKLKVPTFADAEWQKTKTDEQIEHTVLTGVKGTSMQSFRARLKDEEIDAIIAFVRTLPDAGKDEKSK